MAGLAGLPVMGQVLLISAAGAGEGSAAVELAMRKVAKAIVTKIEQICFTINFN
jgi:hypothetical protein